MATTIKDVALHCGMEQDVVRRVLLAQIPEVEPGVIEKIHAAARALDYRPRYNRLGIVFVEESDRGLTHPFFAPILNAIKDEASAQGYDITFINHRKDFQEFSYGIDGLCLVCVDFESPEILEIVRGDLPCVTIDHIFKGVAAVLSDNEIGIQTLVEYAIKSGHERIAFVHGHNNSIVTRARIHQFMSTMGYYKLPVPPEYIREGKYDNIPLTREIVLELLKLSPRPTCILLPDDITYLGAQEAAHEMGMDVPGDISFMGYDGIDLIQKLTPQLTTIRQNTREIGKKAAQLLIEQIEKPRKGKGRPHILPVEFVAGQTVSNLKL